MLNNIKINKEPFEIIDFLKQFMKLYKNEKYKDDLHINTKIFILLGLCNCEYVNDTNRLLLDLRKMVDKNDVNYNEKNVKSKLDPNNIFNGSLQKMKIKFTKTKISLYFF